MLQYLKCTISSIRILQLFYNIAVAKDSMAITQVGGRSDSLDQKKKVGQDTYIVGWTTVEDRRCGGGQLLEWDPSTDCKQAWTTFQAICGPQSSFFSVPRPVVNGTGFFELKCPDEYDGNPRLFFLRSVLDWPTHILSLFIRAVCGCFFLSLKIYFSLKVVLHVRSIKRNKIRTWLQQIKRAQVYRFFSETNRCEVPLSALKHEVIRTF